MLSDCLHGELLDLAKSVGYQVKHTNRDSYSLPGAMHTHTRKEESKHGRGDTFCLSLEPSRDVCTAVCFRVFAFISYLSLCFVSCFQLNRSVAAALCAVLYPPMCRMDGATMNIVGTKIKPIIFVKVEVQPENNLANIMVERVELDGSEAVRSAGGSFNGEDIES